MSVGVCGRLGALQIRLNVDTHGNDIPVAKDMGACIDENGVCGKYKSS